MALGIAIIIFIFIGLPIIGIELLILGVWGYAILCYVPLMCLIIFFIYDIYVVTPRNRQLDHLRQMHNIPCKVSSDNCQWGMNFQQIIRTAIENVTQNDKKDDLLQCGRIVEKMTKDKSFDDLYCAFSLTGCNMKIIDNKGEVIKKII